MTILPPSPGEPRRPHGPRDPGDAWVVAPTGERYWGRYGAAGLLAIDPDRGVLLQHRVSWSHFGGTWALPGGARHQGESAVDGAIREATEEAGVPAGSVVPRLMSVLDLGYWSYATLVADVVVSFEPVISDPESVELSWVPVDAVTEYPLHPGFAASWQALRSLLPLRPVVVVDAANVVGSVPDGWWRDRQGAAEKLVARLASQGLSYVESSVTWFPEIVVAVEGQARGVLDAGAVRVVEAPGSGDDEIVRQCAELSASGNVVTVVTSDRALAARCEALGATVHGTRWLLDQLA